MIETLIAIGLLYILPISYQARIKFRDEKRTIGSSIISSFVVITGVYVIFGFYFYILHLSYNYLISIQLNKFIFFIISAIIIIGGVFIMMFVLIKTLGFFDKKLDWKR
tara:strand:- start:201 stop:524 length:324 start_codon:yes stop_codon:yes gene_type:complete